MCMFIHIVIRSMTIIKIRNSLIFFSTMGPRGVFWPPILRLFRLVRIGSCSLYSGSLILPIRLRFFSFIVYVHNHYLIIVFSNPNYWI